MKTSELIGPALDWAVAKCEGYEFHYDVVINGNVPTLWLEHKTTKKWVSLALYIPSTNWKYGGPIIDREDLHWGFGSLKDGVRTVVASKRGHMQKPMLGPTPLIAAMRCLVAYKLGDEVEIPEELA